MTLPFVAASRLMADGVGFAGEGDLVGAAGTWLLNRLCPPARFSEIFTIDFRGQRAAVEPHGRGERGHGPHGPQGPAGGPAARRSPAPAAGNWPWSPAFAAGPGHALRVDARARQGRWRLIASRVTIEDFGPLACLPVPHSKMSPRCDVRAVADAPTPRPADPITTPSASATPGRD